MRNLPRKRRKSHGLNDKNTRDFLRGTVHPNVIHWFEQVSLQKSVLLTYMLCHYLILCVPELAEMIMTNDEKQLVSAVRDSKMTVNDAFLEMLNKSVWAHN
jgi:hypothetical protein